MVVCECSWTERREGVSLAVAERRVRRAPRGLGPPLVPILFGRRHTLSDFRTSPTGCLLAFFVSQTSHATVSALLPSNGQGEGVARGCILDWFAEEDHEEIFCSAMPGSGARYIPSGTARISSGSAGPA